MTLGRIALSATLVLAVSGLGGTGIVLAQEPVEAPQASVPEIFTLMGQYVRVAYNTEGFATLGYRMAQLEVGNEWVMLEVGLTMLKGAKDYMLKRDDLSLKTPDG